MNVDRMLRQISTRQLSEWRAYADLEPFDEGRADLRAASIVQAFLNLHRRKGRPPIALQDCALRFTDRTPVPTGGEAREAREQVRRTMDVLMMIYNQPPERKKRSRR